MTCFFRARRNREVNCAVLALRPGWQAVCTDRDSVALCAFSKLVQPWRATQRVYTLCQKTAAYFNLRTKTSTTVRDAGTIFRGVELAGCLSFPRTSPHLPFPSLPCLSLGSRPLKSCYGVWRIAVYAVPADWICCILALKYHVWHLVAAILVIFPIEFYQSSCSLKSIKTNLIFLTHTHFIFILGGQRHPFI